MINWRRAQLFGFEILSGVILRPKCWTSLTRIFANRWLKVNFKILHITKFSWNFGLRQIYLRNAHGKTLEFRWSNSWGISLLMLNCLGIFSPQYDWNPARVSIFQRQIIFCLLCKLSEPNFVEASFFDSFTWLISTWFELFNFHSTNIFIWEVFSLLISRRPSISSPKAIFLFSFPCSKSNEPFHH